MDHGAALKALGLMVAGVAAFWLLTADGGGMAMPDPVMTPGAVADSDPDAICSTGYAEAHREAFGSPGEYRRYVQVMASYAIPRDRWRYYQMDHLVPLCLGGADAVENLWSQPWREAKIKDEAERAACKAACAAHTAEAIEQLQVRFMSDWRTTLTRAPAER